MITFTYNVYAMSIDSTLDAANPHMVTGVYLRVIAYDDVIKRTAEQTIYISNKPGSAWLPYDQLTNEIVTEYVVNSGYVSDVKDLLTTILSEMAASTNTMPVTPPWLNNDMPDRYNTSTAGAFTLDQDILNQPSAYRNAEMEAAVQRVLISISGGTI
jgi:hypothetical protein